MADVRAITVRQPWAYAIAHLGKDVENRDWGTTWRGPLLIHAGKGIDREDCHNVAHRHAGRRPTAAEVHTVSTGIVTGAVIAVATMTDDHVCPGKCSRRWAVSNAHHFTLTNVQPLTEPIPAKGALGLWKPTADVLAAVEAQMPGWSA